MITEHVVCCISCLKRDILQKIFLSFTLLVLLLVGIDIYLCFNPDTPWFDI